mgnify:CR=1 FL=1
MSSSVAWRWGAGALGWLRAPQINACVQAMRPGCAGFGRGRYLCTTSVPAGPATVGAAAAAFVHHRVALGGHMLSDLHSPKIKALLVRLHAAGGMQLHCVRVRGRGDESACNSGLALGGIGQSMTVVATDYGSSRLTCSRVLQS